MSADIEYDAQLEALMWRPTGDLRWYRPAGCDDTERVLQQLYERVTGERQWREEVNYGKA